MLNDVEMFVGNVFSNNKKMASRKMILPSIFDNYFCYASDVHTYNTRLASKSNFYKARFRTNIGKRTLSALAANHWEKLPHDIKDLNLSIFPRKAKQYLLRKQM